MAAHKQRQLTGRSDADVSFFIKGKWPYSGRKKLDGKRGPVGYCAAEFEHDVLCIFKADEVIRYASQFLATITVQATEAWQ